MVTRCVVCKRDYKSSVNISFHRFPRDADQLQAWKNIIGKENVAKEGRICSSHFVESDIRLGPGGKKVLRVGAEPVFNMIVSDASEESIRSKDQQIIRGESSQIEPQQYKIETIYDSPEPNFSTSFPASTSSETGLTFRPEADLPKEVETFVNNGYKIETIYDSPEPNFSTSFPASTSSGTELTFRPEADLPKEAEAFVNNGYKTETIFDSPESNSSTITYTSFSTSTASETERMLSLIPQVDVPKEAETSIRKEYKIDTVFDSLQSNFFIITPTSFPASTSSGTDLISLMPQADVPKEAETLLTKGKRKRRYFGDCEADDMYDPIVAKQNWEIAKKTITIQRKKIRGLQQVNRRLKSRVTFLNSFIHHLKDRHLHK